MEKICNTDDRKFTYPILPPTTEGTTLEKICKIEILVPTTGDHPLFCKFFPEIFYKNSCVYDKNSKKYSIRDNFSKYIPFRDNKFLTLYDKLGFFG